MLSQVYINGEYTQRIISPLATPCYPKENKIEAILVLQCCLFLIATFMLQHWQEARSSTSNWFYSSEGIYVTLLHLPNLWNLTSSYFNQYQKNTQTKKQKSESLVWSISTVLLRVGSNSCFPFISSFICLHVFSSPSSFVSVLQDNRSSLSSDSDRAHFVYLLRHKGTFPGFWGRLMVRNCATNWLAYVLCVRGYFALISLALILRATVGGWK